jgi:uncharacterized SAM-binding protein YcdF (DUF218 family)
VILSAAWVVSWGLAAALIVEAPMEHADVIAMLSGSAVFKERAERSAVLYREGRSSKILLTNDNLQGGWSSKEQRNPYHYERAVEELRRSGVPQENIIVLTQPVFSTYEEAVALRDYAKSQGLHSILVVTSSYHSRRVLWTFRQVFQSGEAAIGLANAKTGRTLPNPSVWWFSVDGWKTVPVEYLKLMYYWLRY